MTPPLPHFSKEILTEIIMGEGGGSKIHDFFGGAGETQKKSTVEKKIVFRFTRENYIVFGHFLKLGVFEQKIDLKKFCVPKSL